VITRTRHIVKAISYSCLGLALLAILGAGIVAWILRDSLLMTGGPCRLLFTDLKSNDLRIQAQARRLAESAVKRVRGLHKDGPVGEPLYSQTVNDLSQFCDKHPTDNLLQLQIDYLGLRD
jgi:hypothetical protein